MRTSTRCSQNYWRTRFANSIKVFLGLFLVCFFLPDSYAQSIQNLDQAANNDYLHYTSPMTWQNGNLNENQAHFIEGHSVPYRAVMHDLPAGKRVTITFGFDLVNSNKYALDFITGYQWLQPHNYVNHTVEETVDPTLNSGTTLSGAPTSWKTINPASYLTDYSGQPAATAAGATAAKADFQNIAGSSNAAGKIGLWGGNFTVDDITYVYKQNNSTIDKVQLLNLANGETKVEWTISFIATGGDAIIAFGGHIARKQDWGLGLTAGGLTGSPYHTREKGWVVDGNAATLGAADRSLKVALSEPTCPGNLCTSQVCDNVCPGSTQTFKVPYTSTATGYEWSITANTAGASFVGGTPATTDSTATITTTQAGTYTVQVILSNGSGFISTCTKTVNVTVTPPPTAVNNSRCGAGEVTIGVSGCNGTLNWYAASSGGSSIATGASYTPNISTTTTFYATCTDARGCESARVPVTATVNFLPTATATSDAKCSADVGGTTANFNLNDYVSAIAGSQSGVTVTWFSDAGLNNEITGSAITSYSVNGSATVYVKVANSNALSCFSSAAVTLTVHRTPTATTASDTKCSSLPGGTTAEFNLTTLEGTVKGAQAGVSVSWFSDLGLTATIADPSHFTTGTTTVYAKVANSNSAICYSSAAVTLTVNRTPSATATSDAKCATSGGVTTASFNLNDYVNTVIGSQTNVTVSWYSDASLTSAITAGDILSYLVNGSATVYAKVANDNATSCYSSAALTLTVNSVPVGSASPATICNGGKTNVVLNSNLGGTTFTWTAAQLSGATITGFSNCASGCGTAIQQTLNNAGTTPGVVRYTVTPHTGSCTGSAFTVDVTVNPTPTVEQPGSQVVCNNTSTTTINFNGAVSGTAFSWTNDNTSIGLAASGTGSSIAAFTAHNSGTTPVTATITVTPSANGCTGASKSFTITVNPTPVGSANPASICSGSTTNVGLSSNVSGTTFTWTTAIQTTPSGGTITGLSNGSGASIAQTLTNTGTTAGVVRYTVTPTANNCSGAPFTVDVTVKPTPTVEQPGNQTVCNNTLTTAVTFSGAVSGTDFNWTNDNTSIGLAGSGTGNIAAFTAANSGTSPVTATITVTPTAGGCSGLAKTFTITVNPTPTVEQPGSQVVCDNTSTTTINFNGAVSGTSFSWTNDNTSIGLAASGTGSSIAAFTAHNSGTTPVTATITVTPSANGCTGASKSFTITVNPTPTVNPVDNITLCMGESMPGINLNGAVSGTTFTWHSSLNIGFGTDGTSNIGIFTATGSNVVATVTVTPSANGCTGTPITFTITVNNCGVTNGTYTQGYYGSTGKSCDGTGPQSSATALITKLLSSGQLTVGRSGRSVVIPSSAATILNSVMPGGGTANKLTVASDVPISNASGSTFQKNYLTKQGRINNVFLSQTITLSLNVRMGKLGEFPIEWHDDPSTPAIEDSRFQTEATTTSNCKDFTAVDCSAKDFYIKGSVTNYLTRGGSQAATVIDLLALANDLLGNVRKPGEVYNGYTVPSYSDVSSAVDVINNAFDGWRYWPGSYNTHLECPEVTTDAVTASSARTAGSVLTEQAADKLAVSAYPNPFNDVIKFTIESKVSGQAQLEIVNMLGQKVATVYNGHIQANKSQVVEYKVPPAAQQNLIYMLRIGGQRVTGKLLKGK